MEGVTRESMRPLLDLQRVDSGADRLNQRKADLPEQRELDDLNEQRSVLAVTHAEAQATLDAVAREQTKLETEINQIDDKVPRSLNDRIHACWINPGSQPQTAAAPTPAPAPTTAGNAAPAPAAAAAPAAPAK